MIVGLLLLAPLACSREHQPPEQPAAPVASTATSGAAPGAAAPDLTTKDEAAKGSWCRSPDPKLAQLWKQLSSADVEELLTGHVVGTTTGKTGCSFSAFLSGTNIVRFEAATPPSLKALDARWTGGDSGSPPPPLPTSWGGLLPHLDQLEPLVQEEFNDGRGNFLTRRLYRASDGSFVLILDYAG